MKKMTIDQIEGHVAFLRNVITPVEMGWLAGIIDGEGTITITPRKRTDAKTRAAHYQVSVRIANTDARIITRIQDIVRKLVGCAGYVHERREHRCKKQYFWLAASRQALVILKVVAPYLVSKHEQAVVAIQLQERLTSFSGMVPNRVESGRIHGASLHADEIAARASLHAQIKVLNRRGPERQERTDLCQKTG